MTQNLNYILAIIAVVVTPTASMLGYFAATGDPSLRPLSATVDTLRGFFGGANDILIEVDWGDRAKANMSESEMKSTLRSAFLSKGIDAHVVITPREGSNRIIVSYKVGASQFGPMRLAETPRAVQSVVAAYRMGKQS
ncbi:hypothetical protein [Aliiroseovarius lamellibrachiae]|mgnify:FL=1|uniref:hypothetical protein n=1 Tax=Aliiroseovarius lamellibrachiae TaxID=1924933 RepID=UPI001BE0CA53|nr:hypothetical protein [Aliiroseovarius lamellibrachiae]MBT2132347.1 hypothetical protein [Aliiroseovarius lamellibrachiae]